RERQPARPENRGAGRVRRVGRGWRPGCEDDRRPVGGHPGPGRADLYLVVTTSLGGGHESHPGRRPDGRTAVLKCPAFPGHRRDREGSRELMRGGFLAAWLLGEGIVAWRSVRREHRVPAPGELLGITGLFLALAALSEYGPAAGLATALA